MLAVFLERLLARPGGDCAEPSRLVAGWGSVKRSQARSCGLVTLSSPLGCAQSHECWGVSHVRAALRGWAPLHWKMLFPQ